MTKDYAKRKPTKKPAPRKNYSQSSSRSLGGPFWLLIGVFIGIVCVGAFYIKQFDMPFIKQLLEHRAAAVVNKSNHQVAKNEHKPEMPRFDFYTVLPHMQVVQTANNTAATTPPPAPKITSSTPAPVVTTLAPVASNKIISTPASTPALTTKIASSKSKHYILQVAAFQTQSDADRVKAQLAMKGFSAKVIVVKTSSSTWYRVLLGPYSSEQIALGTQQKLAADNVQSFLRRLAA